MRSVTGLVFGDLDVREWEVGSQGLRGEKEMSLLPQSGGES